MAHHSANKDLAPSRTHLHLLQAAMIGVCCDWNCHAGIASKSEKAIVAEHAGENNREDWFHLVFLRRKKSNYIDIEPRRNLTGALLNRKFKNIHPRVLIILHVFHFFSLTKLEFKIMTTVELLEDMFSYT